METTKKPSSRQLVRECAKELLEHGVEPTQTKIRDMIEERAGTKVSPNLVVEELRGFWADLGKELAAKLNRPGIPAPVVEAFEQIWCLAMDRANESLAREKQEAKELVERANTLSVAASERAEALEHQVEVLQAEGNQLRQQIGGQQDQLDAQTREVSRLNDELRLAATRIATLEADTASQTERHAEEIERMGEMHAQEIERLNASHLAEVNRLTDERNRDAESWEGLRKHLMSETDRLRQASQAEIADLQRHLATAQRLESEHRVAREKASAEAVAAKTRLEVIDGELRRAQTALSEQAQKHAIELLRATEGTATEAAATTPVGGSDVQAPGSSST